MRPKINTQSEFDLHPSNLKITNDYFAKYLAISDLLDDNPGIVDAVHHDLELALKDVTIQDKRGAQYKFTSDTILRIALCQIIEGCSLRQIIVRIDDSHFLRRFVRIFNGPMIDFTAFCKLKNRIPPETWKTMNELLARTAVEGGCVEGGRLRLDTTAVETNIHYPTDSSLLWDTYRTLARLIERVREIDPALVGDRRRLLKKVKKLQQKIARKASKSARSREALKPLYGKLFGLVENILQWANEIAEGLAQTIAQRRYTPLEEATMEFCRKELVQ